MRRPGLAPKYTPGTCLDGVFCDHGTHHHGYAIRRGGRSIGTITGGYGAALWLVRVNCKTLIETSDEAEAVRIARAALEGAGNADEAPQR